MRAASTVPEKAESPVQMPDPTTDTPGVDVYGFGAAPTPAPIPRKSESSCANW
ncbi:hypothetical protein GAR06_03391 [Micromonospora saelicesensis]|nr:hypothetical protein GAR06_03391 [Micromonospora saelicesensis]RAO53534.1 hypothetical protein LUPAC06_05404 [Micromonospora saelicesensis]